MGNAALTAGAPHGGVLLAAAVPDALLSTAVFTDAVLPVDAVPVDAFLGGGFPFDQFANGGLPADDDPNFLYPDDVSPEDPFRDALLADDVFPEDPFPELLFKDVLFADVLFAGDLSSGGGAATGTDRRGNGAPRAGVEDRVAAAAVLVRADLSADGAGLIDQIRGYENIKCWAAGQQARLAVAFELRHREEQAEHGAQADPGQANPGHAGGTLAAEDLGKPRRREQTLGAAEQIALARGESPNRGGRLLGMAKALVTEMPHTLAALDTGQLNEERTIHVVKETACLSVEDRAAVDEELAADTGTFTGAGTRAVIAAARAAAIRRDARSVTQRASHAASERSVSLRPAPDCMTYLTALLPAHEGVAVYAALTRHADTLKSAGDPRSRNQAMADTLVERTTGTPGGITGIDISLVMTDRTLLQADTEPARLAGYGVVPAAWARELITQEKSDGREELKTWLRRLYTAPRTGDLVAIDSKRRLFPPKLRRFIQVRDDTCRTPYCDAPIRHHDHIIPWHNDGPTTLANGAGLCEACNHTKEQPGWKTNPRPGPRHTIEITTPTGHTYQSTAPPLPGTGPAGIGRSSINLSGTSQPQQPGQPQQ